MIELEIQALSERREGLIIEVGRLLVASGFVLQRQRLAQDPHGTLLTMVVRGPRRRQRALDEALGHCERFISFEIAPFVEGETRPHFAASRKTAYVAPQSSAPAPAVASVASVVKSVEKVPPAPRHFDEVNPVELTTAAPTAPVDATPKPRPESVSASASMPPPAFEFLAGPPVRAPAPAPTVEVNPFVEVISLGPDEAAIEEKVMRELEDAYPRVVPLVFELDRAVEEGAREPSLSLAGQRVGAWVFQQDHASSGRLGLGEAIDQIGLPALSDLVEVEEQGGQLHILHSPLCTEGGHSGCIFFSGYLEGLLRPVVGAELSVIAVGCRSWGAGECVLAVSLE